MRIYYITDCVLDNRIVHATHVDEVCKNLAVAGHEVRLYTPATREFTPTGVYDIRYVASWLWPRSVFFQVHLFFRLCLDMVRTPPAIIYGRQSQFLFVPVLVGKMFGVPVVWEVNGRLLEEARQTAKTFLYRMLLKLRVLEGIERMNVSLASGLVVVSPGIKDYLLSTYTLPSDKVVIIANGVDTDVFVPSPSAAVRETLQLDNDTICIGYLGSLHVWQGLRFVAEAALLLRDQLPRARFVVVGEGGDREYLESFVREHKLGSFFDLHAAIKRDQAPDYINAFDICLSYPIKARGGGASPFKVYEYLACGKPVVVSDIGGVRDEFGESVAYAEPESPQALAAKILALAQSAEKRQELGNAGRAYVERDYSWRAVTKKILAVFEKHISSL